MVVVKGSRRKGRVSTAPKHHERIPIDATLRMRAEKMFAHYRGMEENSAGRDARQHINKPHSLAEVVEALRPDVVMALSRSLEAYDAGKLSIANQKKFCNLLRKNVELEGF